MSAKYRFSAWMCILSAALTIPSLVLVFAGGLMEGAFGVVSISFLALMLEVVLSAIFVYVLLTLKNYINEKSINGIFWAVIYLTVFLTACSILSVLIPSLEIFVIASGVIFYMPLGILYIILGVKLKGLRTHQGRSLRAYAALSIITGIVLISFIFIVALPVLSMALNVVLANVFLKASKCSIEQLESIDHSIEVKQVSPPNDNQTLKIQGSVPAYLLLIIMPVIIAADAFELLRLYDLVDSKLFGSDALVTALLSLVHFIKGLIIIFLIRLSGLVRLSPWLTAIVSTYFLMTISGVYQYLFYSPSSLFGFFNLDYFAHGFFRFLVNMILALAYLFIGMSLWACKHSLNGYKKPLAFACFFSGIFMAVYFIDTATLVSLLLIDLCILLLLLSAMLSGGKCRLPRTFLFQAVFISFFWLMPLLVFVGYNIWRWSPHIKELSTWVMEVGTDLTEMKITPMAELQNKSDLIGPYEKNNVHAIYNDMWITSSRWYAVDKFKLYSSSDLGGSWEKVKPLSSSGLKVRFDQTGQKGWMGDPWISLERTLDYGQSWGVIDPEAIYKKIMNKPLDDSFFSNASAVYLDPESGRGGFTLNCRYFYTSDFAESWSHLSVTDAEGKQLCVNDFSPAVNRERDLAVVGNILYFYLYKKVLGENYWEKVCGLGDDMIKAPCSEAEDLTEHEKQFVDGFEKSISYPNSVLFPNNYVRNEISEGGYLPVELINPPPYSVEGVYWYSDDKKIFYTDDSGREWKRLQFIPELKRIVPLTDESAFAWTFENVLYQSSDGGRTWGQYFSAYEGMADVYSIQYSDTSKMLWVLLANELISINTKTGKIVQRLSHSTNIYRNLGQTSSGQIVWLYSVGMSEARISFDGGVNWIDVAANSISKDQSGEWGFLTIHDIYCESASSTCYLLRSDRSLSELTWDGSQEVSHDDEGFAYLPPLVNEDDYYIGDIGYIVVKNRGAEIMHIFPGSRYAYTSKNKGLSWAKKSLKSRSDWQAPIISESGSIFVSGGDEAAITHDFGKNWIVTNPSEWGDSMSVCWGSSAKVIFLLDRGRLIQSIDGGITWVRYVDNFDTSPACGFANNYMWLIHSDLSVYKIRNQVKH